MPGADSDLQKLMAATDVGALLLDRSLRIRCFAGYVTELCGLTPADAGRPITEVAHRLDYDELAGDARAVLTSLAPVQREVRSRDGRWYELRMRPCGAADDTVDGVAIAVVDVTERRNVEQERWHLLLGELTHRVKNSLAVAQSIARQTLRTSPSPDQFLERFCGRLTAMANIHGLLVQSDWHGADLAALARIQLEPFAAGGMDRLHIEGPALSLPTNLATPCGLVLHELADNASRHGALSGASGTVTVSWTLTSRNGQRLLTVVWRETGGPRVTAPASRGLGSTLIESGIPDATVRQDFDPEGLVCTIELPLPEKRDR
jgi:two-component system, chemotaxis family, CheB/CheR fusion protein